MIKKVLARKNWKLPYCPENCFWRDPLCEWEAKTGIEHITILEPDSMPLSSEDKKKLKKMNNEEARMFKIWKRILWRAEVYSFIQEHEEEV